MKGFVIDHITVEMSDEKAEKINVTTSRDDEPVFVDGNKFKNAYCEIKFTSTGDVSDIEDSDLLQAINEKLGTIIELNDA